MATVKKKHRVEIEAVGAAEVRRHALDSFGQQRRGSCVIAAGVPRVRVIVVGHRAKLAIPELVRVRPPWESQKQPQRQVRGLPQQRPCEIRHTYRASYDL